DRSRAPPAMSASEVAGTDAPPATAPGDVVVAGLRRGVGRVFLRVFVAGQALAWVTYAASRWYHPYSWFKIGMAETLSSVRVPFTASASGSGVPGPGAPGRVVVATGALTIAVLVLAYRAGREQARAFERRAGAASLAGSEVATARPRALCAVTGVRLSDVRDRLPGHPRVRAVGERAARAGAVAGVRDAAGGER